LGDLAEGSAAVVSASQHAETVGVGNVVIQVVGDGNMIAPDRPHLFLTRYAGRRRDPGQEKSQEELLRPFSRSIDLLGREGVLRDLWSWLESGKGISVRVLVGRAGRGKTRTALTLCEEAAVKGWRAGFMTGQELERFQEKQNAASWGWNAPTLVVVDYAASNFERLREWLGELADHEAANNAVAGKERPLRLLLLERQADPQTGWWQAAFGGGDDTARAVRELLDPDEPLTLPSFEDDALRRTVIAAMLERVGSPLRPPEAGADADFDRRLAELTWGGEPLFLMMAALLSKQSGFANVLALARDDLALQMADREITQIERIAKAHNVSPSFARHVAAVATLHQGLDRKRALEVISEEKSVLAADGADRNATLSALIEVLPRPDGGIDTVQPDFVAEALLLRVWDGKAGREGTDAVLRAMALARTTVLAVIIRSCQDFAIDGHAGPLRWLEAAGVEAEKELPLLLELVVALPAETSTLRGVSCSLTEAAVSALRHFAGQSSRHDHVLAVALRYLSNRLSALGRRDEALSAIEESVAIQRAITERSDGSVPELALSLVDLSSFLGELGRLEEALSASESSVEMLRDLATVQPVRRILAASLHQLASHLMAMRRFDDALLPSEESVSILRELVVTRVDALRDELAGYLTDLSRCLSSLGRHEAALLASNEGVAILRKLAATQPDAFIPHLAFSLDALSNRLAALDRLEAALSAVEEAVKIRRELVTISPESFLPDLSSSLNNLANRLGRLGRLDKALLAINEAIEIRRPLAIPRPELFNPDLAASLGTQGTILLVARREEEAAASFAAALVALRPSLMAVPEVHAQLAMSLLRDYLKAAVAAGVVPDPESLMPIVKKLVEIGALKDD
jgi:tetratricopeptide (TPR) repeat protein